MEPTPMDPTPHHHYHHHHHRPLLHIQHHFPQQFHPHPLSPLTFSLLLLLLFHHHLRPPDHHHHNNYHRCCCCCFDMAQKREKEEMELKVPETLTLCTQSIAGAPAKISGSDEHRSASPDRSDLKTTTGAVVDSRSSSGASPERSERPDLDRKLPSPTAEAPVDDSSKVKRREINRCSGCRRKVGLMGFRCRCGEMFCSDHRYSDRHDCSYDYKAAGREAIARENPVVRAAKILKV